MGSSGLVRRDVLVTSENPLEGLRGTAVGSLCKEGPCEGVGRMADWVLESNFFFVERGLCREFTMEW